MSIRCISTRQNSDRYNLYNKGSLGAQPVLNPEVQQLLLGGCVACCREMCGSSELAWPSSTDLFSLGSSINHPGLYAQPFH